MRDENFNCEDEELAVKKLKKTLFSVKFPTVAAGAHERQNEIAARIGYFKLGLNVKTERPTVEQIKTAVKEVLENPGYNKAVKTLSVEFQCLFPRSR